MFFKVDVTDEMQVSEMFVTVQAKHEKLNYLVNAAAFYKAKVNEDLKPSRIIVKYACIFMSRKRPVF